MRELLTFQQAGKILGLHRTTVSRLVEDGTIGACVAGAHSRRIPISAIAEYLGITLQEAKDLVAQRFSCGRAS